MRKELTQMKVSSIRATSRCACKIKDNFYTVEYTEERTLDDGDDIEKERADLWNTVNSEVDNQIEEIFETFK